MATPIPPAERSALIDALRGFALFGVLVSNYTSFAGAEILATPAQMAALSNPEADAEFGMLISWLVDDKANTLFAFLFGVGLAVQQRRAARVGADATDLITRRMLVLLCFGVAHLLLLWPWDVLHVYALAGLTLVLLKDLPVRWLLGIGIPLTFLGREVVTLIAWLGGPVAGATPEAMAARNEWAIAGEYRALYADFARTTWNVHLGGGELLGWYLHSLGRAMIGLWAGRQAWLFAPAQHRRAFLRVLLVALPMGLGISLAGVLLQWAAATGRLPQAPSAMEWGKFLERFGSPPLALGYLALLALVMCSAASQRALQPFVLLGRMPFTNYVMQSALMVFTLTGIAGGLQLAGYIGTRASLVVCVAIFALQALLSQAWLARFRFGPMEWVWRRLSYGGLPPLSVGSVSAPAARSVPR